MARINFLTLAEVIEIHYDQIERYGGRLGVRDFRLLESALAMPEASFAGEYLHLNLFEMAAVYAFYICSNHPFIDGNTRTALVCALLFLELNGINMNDPIGILYNTMIDVAAGKADKHKLAAILRRLVG